MVRFFADHIDFLFHFWVILTLFFHLTWVVLFTVKAHLLAFFQFGIVKCLILCDSGGGRFWSCSKTILSQWSKQNCSRGNEFIYFTKLHDLNKVPPLFLCQKNCCFYSLFLYEHLFLFFSIFPGGYYGNRQENRLFFSSYYGTDGKTNFLIFNFLGFPDVKLSGRNMIFLAVLSRHGYVFFAAGPKKH